MPSYNAGEKATCPHCRTVARFENVVTGPPNVPNTSSGHFGIKEIRAPARQPVVAASYCPACGEAIVTVTVDGQAQLVWPMQANRDPVPPEVPAGIAGDFLEAARVLPMSPKASAALSRRCLQHLLRDKGFDQKDLAQQIDAALPGLPAYISENVDVIRNSGNMAAHPWISHSVGAIVDVEPGEAEWNLDVLEQLFQFYYVQPEVARKKREAYNDRLRDAGKPPLKS